MSASSSSALFRLRMLGTALIGGSLINLMMLAFKPIPTYATGDACAGFNPYVCVTVFGSGGTVEQLGASRGLVKQMCNYHAKWELFNSSGNLVAVYNSPTQSGCSYARGWFKQDIPNTNLGIGGQVCATWYEGGSQVAGRPCKRLG